MSGPLRFRGRMFKQIKTLQDAGIECVLVHGWSEDQKPDYSVYSFPVTPIRVIWEKSKLLTLYSLFRFNYSAARAIERSGAAAVVCINLGTALGGALAKKQNPRVKYIFDSNELSLEMYNQGIKGRIFAAIQSFALKHADIVMHAEAHRLEYFNKTYPNKAQPFLLENLPYYRGEMLSKSECRRFVYLGIIGPERYIEEMIEAFSLLGDERITLDLIGFGRKEYVQKIKGLCKDATLKNVRILPSVAHNEIYEVLSKYDIGIAFYRNLDLNYYYCAPNKVYDYIQMGMPVITNDFPGLIDIVQKNKVGVCISEVTADEIKNAIQALGNNQLHENITESVRRRYSWETQSESYLNLFMNGNVKIQ